MTLFPIPIINAGIDYQGAASAEGTFPPPDRLIDKFRKVKIIRGVHAAEIDTHIFIDSQPSQVKQLL